MRTRSGISTVVMAGIVVLIIIIAIGAYIALSSSSAPSTSSSTTPPLTTSSTTTSSTTTSSTDPDAALYLLAKQEGSVTVYGAPTGQEFGNITAAFKDKYPGITVTFTSLQPPQAIPKINTELQTQGYSADVSLQGGPATYPLEQAGNVIPFVSSFTATFPKASLDPLNQSTPVIELAIGWVYNTQMVKQADVPTTMAQVANSKFNGQVVMNDPTTGTTFTQYWATLATMLGNSTVYNFLHSLKNATSPTVLPTTSSCATDAGSGAHAICLGAFMQQAAPDIQAGQPLKFLNITGLPLLITPSYAAVVKGAQHPNAAKLLVDFMASPAGQTAWGNIDVRTPVNPSANAKWSLNSTLQKFDPGYTALAYFPSVTLAAAATAWGKTFAFVKA